MMPALSLHWNRCRGDVWGQLYAVDLEDPHFDGLEGVCMVWKGGSQPAAIAVGMGVVRDVLKELRDDQVVSVYKGKTLLVSWAKVEKNSQAADDPRHISHRRKRKAERLKQSQQRHPGGTGEAFHPLAAGIKDEAMSLNQVAGVDHRDIGVVHQAERKRQKPGAEEQGGEEPLNP